MQDVAQGDHPSKSDVLMLPILDLNPNDKTCIYSVLLIVIEQSKKLSVTTPITFDQPLWIKALEIITAKKNRYRPFIRKISYVNVVLWQRWHYNGWVWY